MNPAQLPVFKKAVKFVHDSLNTSLTMSANILAMENAHRVKYGALDG